MKHRSFLAILAVGVLFVAGSAMAGNGRWNNNCGPGWGGGYRGGYYNNNCYNGPRGGWGGWGWGGPAFGITIATAPRPVYRTVYVQQAPNYGYGYNGENVLVAAQKRLARMGYYRGYIDGEFGPMTSNALANYQSNYGLPITGRLDSRTIASLGL